MRALDRLAACKGQFGRDAQRRTAALLEQTSRTRFRRPADLLLLHETALFLRAFPPSRRVARLADRILFSFAGRMRGVDPDAFDHPETSGIAGTAVSTNFSYAFASSLGTRHPRDIAIDWENYEQADRIGSVLSELIPASYEDYAIQPHVDWQKWFEQAGCTLGGLLKRIDPRTYDLLEIPLRWDLRDPRASRSGLRLPRRDFFYHTGPFLKRSDVSIASELDAPPICVQRCSPARAQSVLDLIVDASAARYRELYGFQYPDLARVDHADLGRGIDLFFFPVSRARRLPVRAYHSGMYFKNGVPIGYVETMSRDCRTEIGFNLYYTFREGETAWLYARILKFLREQLRAASFSIDPYQLGHENEEAIDSGAFWFYRKLGFEPSTPEIAALTRREESKIAANPGYRTPPAILRRLAAEPLSYEIARRRDG